MTVCGKFVKVENVKVFAKELKLFEAACVFVANRMLLYTDDLVIKQNIKSDDFAADGPNSFANVNLANS